MKKLSSFLALAAGVIWFGARTAGAFAAVDINPKYYPTDIESHWAYPQLHDLVDADILNGYPNQTIGPDGTISRAEFAQLLVNAVGEQKLETYGQQEQKRAFADVQPGDWYYSAVHLLASIGFVDGVDEEHFEPNRNVQRAEMAKMIHNVFQITDGTYPPLTKHFTDIPDDYWAKQPIERLTKAGLIDGYEDGSFKPTASATRAEAATMIYNVLHKQEGAPADDMLTSLVLDYEKQSLQRIEAGDFQGIYQLNADHATGYLKAFSDWSTDHIVSSAGQGYTLRMKPKQEPTATVVEKSAFSAAVRLDEQMEMTLSKGDFTQTTTMDTSGVLYLRHMPDNSWKIYDNRSE